MWIKDSTSSGCQAEDTHEDSTTLNQSTMSKESVDVKPIHSTAKRIHEQSESSNAERQRSSRFSILKIIPSCPAYQRFRIAVAQHHQVQDKFKGHQSACEFKSKAAWSPCCKVSSCHQMCQRQSYPAISGRYLVDILE
ncbi:hypothetical protein B9Z55_017525 [Caenorhabditis nigoni]|uniref:Uncharacterized protein n=1 Tax=Caenorhabditis nigoni TaxID=1611254 RepID=A0A2G5T9W5_9PELO|nr:hypothetical protein B9Z55_017525 [Caenorhabditis nigoni]